jgi:pimeloyl-ACP methyl ester carboxylesterase
MELNYHREGRGEPLVLMHGIGSRWQVWAPVIPRLAAERDVIAIDLPGFGASPMPPAGTPAGIGPLTRLVAEFLDSIGLQAPHVAGNSLGGWISLELAKQGRVRSATGLSPGGFYNEPERRFAVASLWLMVRAARALEPRADRLLASPRGRRLAFGQVVARAERIPPADAAEHSRALARAPWFDDTLRALARERFADGRQISVPVTIAWGERDRLLLPREARRAEALIPGARMVTLRGCGHVPTYDDPDQVATVLLEASAPPAAPGR